MRGKDRLIFIAWTVSSTLILCANGIKCVVYLDIVKSSTVSSDWLSVGGVDEIATLRSRSYCILSTLIRWGDGRDAEARRDFNDACIYVCVYVCCVHACKKIR